MLQEWIESRGPCGKRRVRSWTPTELVQRANSYLLDALYYDTQESEVRLLPQVTAKFVARNHLESAVQDGVLHVKGHNPSPSYTFGLPQDTLSLDISTSP